MDQLNEKIGKILKKKAISNKALALFEQNNVVSFEVDSHMSDELNLIFAMVKDHNYHEVDLAVSKEDVKLVNARCNCENFSGVQAPCEHIGAALYKYRQQFLPKLIASESVPVYDDLVKGLVDEYRTRSIQHLIAENKNQQVSLKLGIDFVDYHYLSLSLKIGKEKFYVIKDMLAFLDMIKMHEQKKYGKDLDLFHHKASFVKPAQKLISFLESSVSDHYAFKNNVNYKSIYQPKYLYVDNARIDELFALLQSGQIEYTIHGKEDVRIVTHNPEVCFDINKLGESYYQLEFMQPQLRFIYNGKQAFVSIDDLLYVCDVRFSEVMVPFLRMFRENSKLTISTLMMQDFYINVIDQVKGYVKLSGVSLEDFKPTHFNAKIMLDLVKMNTISAKLLFTYGEYEINAILKNKYDIVRNYALELTIVMILKKYFRFVDEQNGVFVLDNSIDLIYEFFKNGFDELSQYANIYTSDKVKNIKIKDNIGMSMG
ncbi:MAG: SNF2 helicase associated domain-containing protein, partial [Erysipelotrichaceae bacterium]